ncbi:hypothetical protein [Bacillus sp. T33-2]|uniref:hypothetical protein n=1 Tax=Bacillus sp. T33-2 TaxID=2054168 RepID=UPI00115ACB94|nr:hypothetical protein [Bacillus sp. T33-2]
MVENENKRNPLFLFGERRQTTIDKEGERAQNIPNDKETDSKLTRDPHWFWGFPRKEPALHINDTQNDVSGLVEKRDKVNPETKDDIDQFSLLPIEERNPNEILKEPTNKSTRGPDWFWDFPREDQSSQTKYSQNSLEKILNGIDQEWLFETIDTVISLHEQIKSLSKDFKPLLDPLTKKFKSK